MQAVCWGLARLDALQGDPVGLAQADTGVD